MWETALARTTGPGSEGNDSSTRAQYRKPPTSTFVVGRPGLEPGTLGLKVPCSTR